MRAYVEFEIEEGAYDISCPDAKCDQDGMLSLNEIATLVSQELIDKHHKFRLNRGEDLAVILILANHLDNVSK